MTNKLSSWRLGRRIMAVLLAWPHHATTAELIEVCYDHGEREGEWAASSIAVCILRLNRIYLPENLPFLRIINRGYRYRLVLRRPQCYRPNASYGEFFQPRERER